MSAADLRLKLVVAGYMPIPVSGKSPVLRAWQKIRATESDVADWEGRYPFAANTGLLTFNTAAIDVDVLTPEVAEAIEEQARERFGSGGKFLVRVGMWPKRLIPLRVDVPFKKKSLKLEGGGGVEILAEGQQFVAFGIHPGTGKPYQWIGGDPTEVRRDELPAVTERDADDFLAVVAELLAKRYGTDVKVKAAEPPLPE